MYKEGLLLSRLWREVKRKEHQTQHLWSRARWVTWFHVFSAGQCWLKGRKQLLGRFISHRT